VVDSALAGRVCRRVQSRNGCDYEEFCDGENIECPPDENKCDDAEYFEEGERNDSEPTAPAPMDVIEVRFVVDVSLCLFRLFFF